MRRRLTLGAALLLAAFRTDAAETAVSDTETWNAGVGYYQSGDVTNALKTLRPLMLTREYGARAAEAVAKLEYERGDLEEASAAAQIALRAAPDDAKANRNFTRATDRLAETREQKRLQAILQRAQGQDAGSVLRAATYAARDLMKGAGAYRTNAAPQAVALADAYSKRTEKLADDWLVVKQAVAQSVTNEEQAATILLQLDNAEKRTLKAAKELGDLDAEGYATMCEVESDFNRFMKQVILPPAAIDEGLLAQTNAWQDLETVNNRPWQQEALDFTRAFRAQFPGWARQYEQKAQADTNMAPFTAEDQAKVSALATELEKIQMGCCEKSLPPEQEKALRLATQIRDLLPKDKNGGGSGQGQPQANPNRQKQDQNKDESKPKDEGEDRKNQGEDESDQKNEGGQEEEKPQDGGEEKKEDEPPATDQETEAILQKAQERNDEHEAKKKARLRKAPLPPNERDW